MKLPLPEVEVLARCCLRFGTLPNRWCLLTHDGANWYDQTGSWVDAEHVLYWLELPNAS